MKNFLSDYLLPLAPLLGFFAAVVRIIPGISVSLKQRARSRNPSHRTLRVQYVNGEAPWGEAEWPADWHIMDKRREFRDKELRATKIWLAVLASLTLVYVAILVGDIYNFLPGSGHVAATGALVFAVLSGFYIEFWRRIVKHGLEKTMYGCRSRLVVTGELDDVRQYCLGVLFEIGARIVCVKKEDAASGAVEIAAATGIWPPTWMSKGVLQLVSFRGKRIDVTISRIEDKRYQINVKSDNVDPGVDEGGRGNKRNVRKFVEGWAFFPDVLVGESAS